MKLNQTRILLTGATGGLGQALAIALSNQGGILCLVGRNNNKLNALKTTLETQGGKVHSIVMDLSKPGASQAVLEQAKQAMGDIDLLINNAGVLDFIELQNQDEGRIAEIINTNVTMLIQMSRNLLPSYLKKNQGHFLFIGSIFGSLGFPHYATYCASKYAVHGFSQALRRELVDTNIGVTYIAPRAIATPMNDNNTVAMLEKAGQQMDSAESVANIIVGALQKKKQEVFIGQPQHFFAWLNGLAPRMVNIGLKKQTRLAKLFLK